MELNIITLIQCFISSILEFICTFVIIYSLKRDIQKKTTIILTKVLVFSLLSTFITYLDNNTFLFRILSLAIIFMFVKTLAKSTIIQGIYLTIISYICLVVIQIFIIIMFQFTVLNQDDFLVQLLGNTLTLLITLLLSRFIPIHYVYEYIIRKDIPFRFFLGNTFVIIVFINYLTNAHLSHFIYYILTISVVVALLIFVNVELLRSRVIVDKQKSIIDSYNKYLPIVDELIEQVRGRQHGYDNNLQSIRALAVSCDNYDTLRTELLKNIDVMSHSDLPVFLLKFNLKLLSGLLFQKYCLATKQHIHIDFTIKNYNIQSVVPEYVLVEAVGILMDNAIEASNKNDTVYITIDCIQNKFHFYIRNIGPIFTSDFFHNIFKRGYTTKLSTGRNHGMGLNNLLEISNQYNGKLTVDNEEHFGTTYLCFSVEL